MIKSKIRFSIQAVTAFMTISLFACSGQAHARVFGLTRTYGDSPAIARAKSEVHYRQSTMSTTMLRWHLQNIERQRHEHYLEHLRLLHQQRLEYFKAIRSR